MAAIVEAPIVYTANTGYSSAKPAQDRTNAHLDRLIRENQGNRAGSARADAIRTIERVRGGGKSK